jgi:hypothetical protein
VVRGGPLTPAGILVPAARRQRVAAQLKAAKGGTGDTTLRSKRAWKTGCADGRTDTAPEAWAFSLKRIYGL